MQLLKAYPAFEGIPLELRELIYENLDYESLKFLYAACPRLSKELQLFIDKIPVVINRKRIAEKMEEFKNSKQNIRELTGLLKEINKCDEKTKE